MYYLWHEKDMLPSEFYSLKAGDKTILGAFAEIKIKDDAKTQGGE
ncbi:MULTISPECIES: hypothetical protein [Clostridium]|uniref:Uncharacterized protein n=1 Tax=Clostridium frigoriphilum TaxID=443253 RepID=A0ABU7UVT7_9CLOT|nr:hypothetical protein [Clostridium sp. DSM 17811]